MDSSNFELKSFFVRHSNISSVHSRTRFHKVSNSVLSVRNGFSNSNRDVSGINLSAIENQFPK